MEIKWLRKALINLDMEVEYIAKDDPQAAEIVVKRIRHAVALLAENPALGRTGRVPGAYELVVPNTCFVLPYRVRPRLKRIEILRVFHAAHKLPKRW